MVQFKIFFKTKAGWRLFGSVSGSSPKMAFLSAGKRGRFKKRGLYGIQSKRGSISVFRV